MLKLACLLSFTDEELLVKKLIEFNKKKKLELKLYKYILERNRLEKIILGKVVVWVQTQHKVDFSCWIGSLNWGQLQNPLIYVSRDFVIFPAKDSHHFPFFGSTSWHKWRSCDWSVIDGSSCRPSWPQNFDISETLVYVDQVAYELIIANDPTENYLTTFSWHSWKVQINSNLLLLLIMWNLSVKDI